MAETNYNVKILVDVQGKKVMDGLAKAGGYGTGGSTAPKQKSLTGGIASAQENLMKGDIGSVFSTLTKSVTGLAAVIGVGVGVLLMAFSNSKILTTLFSTVGRLLGYLVDIILLPLMPFLIQGIRWLYQMVIAFKNFTKNLSLESILKFGINLALLTNPITWLVGLLMWATGNGTIKSTLSFTFALLEGVGGWLWSLVQWAFTGAGKLVNSLVDLTINIGSAIVGALASAASFALTLLQYMFGIGAGPSLTTLTLDLVANAVGWVWDFLKSLWSAGKSTYNIAAGALGLPSLDSGGTVAQTGVAVVHKGETYSGVNSSGTAANSGGNSYTFQMTGSFKSETEMFNKFMELMRQKGLTKVTP
ncbi:hypothetical protein [Methanoregula sp.]|jgi:hypothetical protein|uniref:hypothetical protein n=1 Tax=Methanoregula sp. TaxID=2052170 RepID=UPI00356AADB9